MDAPTVWLAAGKIGQDRVRIMTPNGDYLDVVLAEDGDFQLRSCSRRMDPMRITPEVANSIRLRIN